MTTTAHPLGDPNATGTDTPDLTLSIVDTVLNLDEFLSGEVRRAERTARFATRPDLQADIEELAAELETLTDEHGKPLDTADDADASVADGPASGARTAEVVAREIHAKQQAYAASFRSVRMRQMTADEWTAFNAKHKRALAEPAPYPPAMWNELIAACAFHPPIPAAKVAQLRTKVGHPAVNVLGMTAWQLNTESGVSVPFSPLSSRVLKRLERDES